MTLGLALMFPPILNTALLAQDMVVLCGSHETDIAGEEFPTVSKKEGNMFELFNALGGAEYTVYVRDDEKRILKNR